MVFYADIHCFIFKKILAEFSLIQLEPIMHDDYSFNISPLTSDCLIFFIKFMHKFFDSLAFGRRFRQF